MTVSLDIVFTSIKRRPKTKYIWSCFENELKENTVRDGR